MECKLEQKLFVDLIAGARPNFVKIAALVHAFDAARASGGRLGYRIVHTGQHYDPLLSGSFFEQLGIPEPAVNLGVGSGTQATQTAAIMTKYEQLLDAAPPEACVVVGDVTSTMACAITAQKLGIPVAHVEGGIRSGDWRMPEEINRLATDAVSNWFFTTSRYANENLRRAGVEDERVHFVGNTMIDTLLRQRPALRPPEFWDTLQLRPRQYLVLTLHRPSNVDDVDALERLLQVIADACGDLRVIFPVHPRTSARMTAFADRVPAVLHVVEPQSYLQFNYLVQHAKGVITDSGGITEEATVFGVPCITLRDTTERPETVAEGTNELVGANTSAIGDALTRLRAGQWKTGRVPEFWDGRAAERIVAVLEQILPSRRVGSA